MELKEFKFNVEWTKSSFFCGLDVHKHELAVAVYSEDGSQSEFLKTNIFQVNTLGLEQFWKFVKKYKQKGQIYFLTRENFEEIYDKVLSQIT